MIILEPNKEYQFRFIPNLDSYNQIKKSYEMGMINSKDYFFMKIMKDFNIKVICNLPFDIINFIELKKISGENILDFRYDYEIYFQTDCEIKAYNIKLMHTKNLLKDESDKDIILNAYKNGEFIEIIKPQFLELENLRLTRLKKLNRILEE